MILPSFSFWNHWNNNLCFTIWVMFWNIAGYIFPFSGYKILKAIVWLLFSIFFQLSFSEGKFIPSRLYLFIKALIFVILSEYYFISSWFNANVTAFWKYLLSFFRVDLLLLFCFLFNQESLYIIHHNTDLFYDI